MLRGPVQASFPSLEHFPREAGASGHVYPFPARSASPVMPQADLRLPSTMASATFWRSPYSEALRQSKFSLPRKTESLVSSRDSHRAAVHEDKAEKVTREEKGSEQVKSILKNGGSETGRDSGSDTSSENVRQIRGILCKSSVSSSSRQSGGKVQKRVKFDESVDRGQCLRHASSASSSGAATRHEHQQNQHRAMSASPAGRTPMRMPSIRHDGERLQSIDKGCLHPSQSQSHSHGHHHHHHHQYHHHHNNPHQHPHIPRPNSGPLIRSSSVPDLTLPRPAPRSEPQGSSYHLVHTPYSVNSSGSAGPGSTSSQLSTTPLEFKIYRQSPMVTATPSPRVSDTGLVQPPPQSRTRYFATRSHSTGSRPLMRLSRSLTSPAINLQRPVKRHTSSSSSSHKDNLPLVLTSSKVAICPEVSQKHVTARDILHARQEEEEETEEKEEERRESFLDDDKTVQILHWLKEVDHKQAREGRCPVFVHGIYREG